MKTQIVACQCKDDKIRMKSSSGGIFPLLASEVISNGGVVYGAAFSSDFSVKHIRVDSEDNIDQLIGSKYVFSRIDNTYRNVESDLNTNKIVLFVGSPCQVAGLKLFLKKKYENLILVDFICHGAPQPQIWEKYLGELDHGRSIKSISFRDKRKGWENYYFVVEFENGEEYAESHDDDVYMRGFSENYTLQEACFNCRHKGVDERVSDLTLGDLWGADKLAPNLYDDRGTSIVMLHSDIGRALFENICPQIQLCEIDSEKALTLNSAALKSVEPNLMRDLWAKDYKKTQDFTKSMKKYTKQDLFHKIWYKLYKIYKEESKRRD